MTDEQRLRDRLSDAVPEPPDSVATAAPVVARARRARRRRVAGSVVGAAASVALVTSLGVALTRSPVGGPDADRGVAAEPAVDPYGVDPCPALSLRDGSAATPLDGSVRSLRLCAYDAADGATAVPLDAVVTDVAALVARIDALPGADPGRCATVTPIAPPTALVVTDADGVRHAFPVGFCSDVTLAGKAVESQSVQALVLETLAAQRTALGPPDTVDPPSTGSLCRVETGAAPLDPARTTLVAGAVCVQSPNGFRTKVLAYPLTGDALARVQRAWTAADEEPADQAQCQALGLRSLVLVTDFGDVVRVTDNGCSLVTGDGASGGASYRLGLDRDDLTDLVRLPAKTGGDPELP